MCGFVGMMKYSEINKELGEQARKSFIERNQLITHRGPDDEGYYEDYNVLFGFRRLSIIDIESGHQPFTYNDDQYWMVFNGEVYNYIELKDKLKEKGYTFSTESDTEVVIAMFQEFGVEAFEQFRGMFAILIWDKRHQTLYGARDRFGIKPLYYKDGQDGLYFASEKKSLLSETGETIDSEALQHYLSFQYVPEPLSMNENINKVEPGHYFVKPVDAEIKFHCYFHATFDPVQQDKHQLTRKIQDVMFDSVGIHMRSDVPVGSFLSGGIDSTMIVAMAKEYNPNIKTFSVGFQQEGYSEVDVAKETAEKLGVENHSYIISPEEYVAELPKIMWHLDDPLADPACVPLYFVAREAKKHVKVVLSGEGADELFGGYTIYREPESLKMFHSIPTSFKNLLAKVAQVIPEGVKGKSFLERGTTPLKDRYIGNAKMFEEKEKKTILKTHQDSIAYQQLTAPLYQSVAQENLVNQMQYIDVHTWLRGDILLKADRMTMAHSLELRVPFLDKEVFDVARQIPVNMKIAEGTTKHILRLAARGVVPDHVLDRKKLGFPVPIRHWLKNELNDWAQQLIQESQTGDILDKQVITKLLDDHCAGKADNSRKLWTVLMFMLWHQIYIENKFDAEKFISKTKQAVS
ncbi:asparagine synthase (glutamine-hydrolyzing) [Gracilibacillus massiliensis]|uniref:asparagine synthase (glutamine-hydrolyzing) n=1 Tax=Gracilibacillus massiliensis TaxID=1564956 RepID=UPI00071E3AAA|nr:asparagine synthase (glutamine-hydrolyzing) [Gracilibacillus massiliensis]